MYSSMTLFADCFQYESLQYGVFSRSVSANHLGLLYPDFNKLNLVVFRAKTFLAVERNLHLLLRS
ncbi:hypothetical protein CKA32_004141 [Geitlerinema sp. FC II]|nr:hypothetical protein CKA32_004141 [Geitlerinema sp. FC II]